MHNATCLYLPKITRNIEKLDNAITIVQKEAENRSDFYTFNRYIYIKKIHHRGIHFRDNNNTLTTFILSST